MIRHPLGLALILLSTLTLGCVPAIHVPLKAEHSSKIRSTRVHALVAQEEVAAAIQPSNMVQAMGGGLVPALIDMAVEAHRTSKASKLMEPIRKEVSDFDFRVQFAQSLEKTVADLPVLKVTHAATTARPLRENERTALWKDIPENAVLSLATTYELTPNFRSLIVATIATLWVPDQEEAVYRGRYEYHTPPVATAKPEEETVKMWAANQGAAVRAAMTQGIAETMKMLTLDLGTSVTPVGSATPKLALFSNSRVHSFPAYLAKDGNRYIARREDGALFSASSDESFVVEAPAAAASTPTPVVIAPPAVSPAARPTTVAIVPAPAAPPASRSPTVSRVLGVWTVESETGVTLSVADGGELLEGQGLGADNRVNSFSAQRTSPR